MQQVFAGTGPGRRGNATVRCPGVGCGLALTAADFANKRPEEEEFEREKEIRRKLARIFNKTAADFAGDAAAYNDYLESVETYVANLAGGVDVERTEAAIRAYASANATSIAVNSARQDAAARESAERVAAEAAARAEAQRRAAAEEGARRAAYERVKRKLMDALLGEARLDEPARVDLKAKLFELQARLQQGQGSGLSGPGLPASAGGAVIGSGAVGMKAAQPAFMAPLQPPCPYALPPRLLAPPAPILAPAAAVAALAAAAPAGSASAAAVAGAGAGSSISDSSSVAGAVAPLSLIGPVPAPIGEAPTAAGIRYAAAVTAALAAAQQRLRWGDAAGLGAASSSSAMCEDDASADGLPSAAGSSGDSSSSRTSAAVARHGFVAPEVGDVRISLLRRAGGVPLQTALGWERQDMRSQLFLLPR